MKYNGIYTIDYDGTIRAPDLDEKNSNPLKRFTTLADFEEVFNSKYNTYKDGPYYEKPNIP